MIFLLFFNGMELFGFQLCSLTKMLFQFSPFDIHFILLIKRVKKKSSAGQVIINLIPHIHG
jgi:hypothetical protein